MAAALLLWLAAQDSLDDLLRDLGGEEVARRDEATRKLSQRGLEDLPSLVEAYAKAEDPERRGRLLKVLPRVRLHTYDELLRHLQAGEDKKFAAVAGALANGDPHEALRQLGNCRGETVNTVLAALLDIHREDDEVFAAVLRAYPSSIPTEFTGRVASYLKVPELAENAIYRLRWGPKGLASTRDVDWTDVAKSVTAIARTPAHPARLKALTALPWLGDERSIEAFLASFTSDDPKVVETALGALGEFLDVFPSLASSARAAEPLIESPSLTIRRWAFEALARAPNPAADLPRVREALKKDAGEVRWGALELAAALGDASLEDEIARLIPEKEGPKAVEALFRISPACAALHLADGLTRQSDMTEKWLEYLNREAEPESLEPIRRALSGSFAGLGAEAQERLVLNAWRYDIWLDAETVSSQTQATDVDDRRRAYSIIGSAATAKGIDILKAGLGDASHEVRREAARAAGRVKARALKEDLLGLVDRDVEARDEAIRALADLGDRDVLPRIFPWLRSYNHSSTALDAIKTLGTAEEAGPLLKEAREMRDKSRAVGIAAKLLGDRAVAALIPLIDDRILRAAVLRELADRNAVEAAPQASRYLSDSDPGVVRAAVDLVGLARTADAVPQLLKLFQDDDVAWAAARALARMPSKDVAPDMVRRLEGSDAGLRDRAAWVLNELDADEFVRRIGPVLEDPDPDVVYYGLETVRRRKLRQHVDRVEALSRGAAEGTRRDALAVLAELDWEGQRPKLLERLRRHEENSLSEVAPFFAARHDEAVVPMLLEASIGSDDAACESMILLNAFRRPEAFARATAPTYSEYSTNSSLSPRQQARRLSRSTGVQIRVEMPPAPFPRAAFEHSFGRNDSIGIGGFGGGRYGFRYGGRKNLVNRGGGGLSSSRPSFSLLTILKENFGTDIVPILEDDAVRLVPRADAVRFWRAWTDSRDK